MVRCRNSGSKRAVMWLSGFEVGPTLRHATMGAKCHLRKLRSQVQCRRRCEAIQAGRAMDYDKSKMATVYDEARSLTPEGLRQWLDLLSRDARLLPGALVVDLGCGTGRFSEPLAEAFFRPRHSLGASPAEDARSGSSEAAKQPRRLPSSISTIAAAARTKA